MKIVLSKFKCPFLFMGKILEHYVEHLCEIILTKTNGLRELIFKEIV